MLRRLLLIGPWLLWTGFILVIVFPWRDLQDHVHWGKVLWVPFLSHPLKPVDLVGNILMYVPFGRLSSRALGERGAWWLPLALAAVVSGCTETSQLFSHSRFPSTTDFVCNLLGCAMGRLPVRPAVRRQTFALSQEISS